MGAVLEKIKKGFWLTKKSYDSVMEHKNVFRKNILLLLIGVLFIFSVSLKNVTSSDILIFLFVIFNALQSPSKLCI